MSCCPFSAGHRPRRPGASHPMSKASSGGKNGDAPLDRMDHTEDGDTFDLEVTPLQRLGPVKRQQHMETPVPGPVSADDEANSPVYGARVGGGVASGGKEGSPASSPSSARPPSPLARRFMPHARLLRTA